MAAILGWFLFMQIFGADEQKYNNPSESILYSGSFYWNKEDGSKQKIDVPGTYEIMPGQTMVITQHFQKIMIKLLLRFVLLYKTLNFM